MRMRKLICTFGALVAVTLAASVAAQAAGQHDDQRIQLYALALGRASACGIHPTAEMHKVAHWVDSQDPETKKVYLAILMQGMQEGAKQQAAGKTGDSCADVRRSLKRIAWP